MHRIFDRFELNFGVAGMLLVGVLILVGAVSGILSFGDLAGIGDAYAAAVGVICAACPNGPGSTFCDPANVRNHWRGHLEIASVIVAIGLVGVAVSGLLS